MMLVIKHNKIGDVCYVSHIDCLRVLQRVIKRAQFDVAYSEGFSPHMRTYFAQPLSLGVASIAEYLVVDVASVDIDTALAQFNKSAPAGLQGEYAILVQKNPNLAKNVTVCEYSVACECDEGQKALIEAVATEECVMCEVSNKSGVSEKNIAEKIFGLSIKDGYLKMLLGAGNNNLRPDTLIGHLNERFGTKINKAEVLRTAQLIQENDGFVNTDEFLKRHI